MRCPKLKFRASINFSFSSSDKIEKKKSPIGLHDDSNEKGSCPWKTTTFVIFESKTLRPSTFKKLINKSGLSFSLANFFISKSSQGRNRFGGKNTNFALSQSYEIKSPPWTILFFRILGIFSVKNIARLGIFMFQTSDNSHLCIDSQYTSQ